MTAKARKTKFSKLQSEFYNQHPPLVPWPNLLAKYGLSLLYKPREIFWRKELDSLKLLPSHKVCDVGCGQGIFLARMNKTYKVKGYGIDISENSIKYACENFESKDLEFIVADATYLPFPGEFFDFVVSFDALEHIDKQKIAIKEMVRVLAPKGKILIYTMNKNYKYTLDWVWEKLGFDIFARAAHKKELLVDSRKIKKQLTTKGCRIVMFRLYDSFFTLLTDELIMIDILICKKLNLFRYNRLGKALLSYYNFISRLIFPVANLLDFPWYFFGKSLGFLVIAEKNE
ncbi:hypothetical protein A2686_01035 [Candidatus Woesebacteria bacterium RIFCSPHIGHO2_01_FULL_38_10]|uniref:Methyltransferase type 11 domain-containing protein n=1 Tax=Candidatus Woesebacteria bacterium RIFCSPLOWO2_01_FULL_39_10b TaxID=1802517 RepID=A0A1F8B7Q4_9BACT|nr:MAG: hypothetical protein A2686_01035 [Candidatus Woesebacteria bacterium RIFCSPHIGHO2_01_FULL_38_10]OGM59388.1 MAG: hypothetical protein A2892_03485 [Candidatus Woesebacteria bacterium RIFCSPLOWO2_01_FULL_39_10b]